MLKLTDDIMSFGKDGSRKAQAASLAAACVLAGPEAGFEMWQCLGAAAALSVYVVARAVHDFAQAWKTGE